MNRLEEVGPRAQGVSVPELALFVGEKRAQLAALAQAACTAPVREALAEVTRVALPRPLGGIWRPPSTRGGVERRLLVAPVEVELDWEDDACSTW